MSSFAFDIHGWLAPEKVDPPLAPSLSLPQNCPVEASRKSLSGDCSSEEKGSGMSVAQSRLGIKS